MLVHHGTPRTLLRDLLDQPTRVKANVVFIQGPRDGDEWAEVSARLASILAETRASGYVLVPDDIEVGAALNELVAVLSHAEAFDVAVARSCGLVHDGPPRLKVETLAGFSEALLDFRISSLAKTYTRRMRSMPAGSKLDLSGLGGPETWPKRRARRRRKETEGLALSAPSGAEASAFPTAPVPDADAPDGIGFGGVAETGPGKASGYGGFADTGAIEDAGEPSLEDGVAARDLNLEATEIAFDRESDGGTYLATVAAAMADADIAPRAREKRAVRFLQQRSFVRRGGAYEDATHGFLVGEPALVRVRIGPPEGKWDSLAAAFPVERLPQHLEQWTLTVWLTEAHHLPEPLKARIKLSQDGASTECDFRFKPLDNADFEGRLTVLHRGRVLQTAVLRSVVRPAEDAAREGRAPALEEWIPVREGLDELEARRQYDLAFVLNHTETGRPLATVLSEKHAWISSLDTSIPIARKLNDQLSQVAKSVADYEEGLDGKNGKALLVQLAKLGKWLHLYIVEQQLGANRNRLEIGGEEYVQIVSTRSDAVIPFEFIYAYETPDDNAQLCDHWREGVARGTCAATCDTTSGKVVCPMGFWGLQKVIERHALTPELASQGHELYLQSVKNRASDTLALGGAVVVGASARVTRARMTNLAEAMRERTGAATGEATSWDHWVDLVRDRHPRILIALAHTDGTGANVSLELGGTKIESIQIKAHHVRSSQDDPRPMVALLGCDTGGTADDFGHHVPVFRARGAAIVIGTIATVFGDHAAEVADRLVEGLLPNGTDTPQRLGEALRALKRKALLDNLLMPLCLVAYGDADWKLARK
ncbi:MAG: hypothetical protein ABL982_03190 [Vicinamibacterales bacterium]